MSESNRPDRIGSFSRCFLIDFVEESIVAQRVTFEPPVKTFAARPMEQFS
jgi:hypothetical protein